MRPTRIAIHGAQGRERRRPARRGRLRPPSARHGQRHRRRRAADAAVRGTTRHREAVLRVVRIEALRRELILKRDSGDFLVVTALHRKNIEIPILKLPLLLQSGHRERDLILPRVPQFGELTIESVVDPCLLDPKDVERREALGTGDLGRVVGGVLRHADRRIHFVFDEIGIDLRDVDIGLGRDAGHNCGTPGVDHRRATEGERPDEIGHGRARVLRCQRQDRENGRERAEHGKCVSEFRNPHESSLRKEGCRDGAKSAGGGEDRPWALFFQTDPVTENVARDSRSPHAFSTMVQGIHNPVASYPHGITKEKYRRVAPIRRTVVQARVLFLGETAGMFRRLAHALGQDVIRRRNCILGFTLVAVLAAPARAETLETPCPQIVLDVTRSEGSVGLSDAEKKLVCGNPSDPTWKNIPPSQAAFHLRGFLQERGYLRPEIRTEHGRLLVDVGAPSKVAKFETVGAPGSLRTNRMREIVGERLTPKLLDTIEKRLTERLQGAGYACSKVQLRADPNTDVVRATIHAGPVGRIADIDRSKVQGIDPLAVSRHDAFAIGDTYNGDALARTARRLITADLVRSAYFLTDCDGGKVYVHEYAIADAPRIVSFAVGANTERLFNVRASWRHTALGELASQLGFDAQASVTEQSFGATGEWYPFRAAPRLYFSWNASARRDNQPNREWYTLEAGFGPARSWDFDVGRLEVRLAPLFRSIHNVRGAAAGTSQMLVVEGRARFVSSDFEYYAGSPRAGFRTQFAIAQSVREALSATSFTALRWTGEKLWNLGHWDPPAWILGVRFAASTTITPEPFNSTAAALQPYRYYLGGRDNLRGFGFATVPGDDLGGFTALTAGVELRAPPFLPGNLEPFVFADVGALGRSAFALEDPVYLTPGVGIRWESPIGTLRGTYSHGLLLTRGARMVEPGHRFYLSIGEEF